MLYFSSCRSIKNWHLYLKNVEKNNQVVHLRLLFTYPHQHLFNIKKPLALVLKKIVHVLCSLSVYCVFQTNLKLVSAIFLSNFYFSPNDSPSKTMKNILFHLKRTFRSQDIQIFVIFSLPFQTFQIQKGKRKWNNSLCHELACVNLQM